MNWKSCLEFVLPIYIERSEKTAQFNFLLSNKDIILVLFQLHDQLILLRYSNGCFLLDWQMFCFLSIDNITIPSKTGRGVLKRVSEVFDCWFESGRFVDFDHDTIL